MSLLAVLYRETWVWIAIVLLAIGLWFDMLQIDELKRKLRDLRDTWHEEPTIHRGLPVKKSQWPRFSTIEYAAIVAILGVCLFLCWYLVFRAQ